jgi:hypothetical protein
VFHLHKVGQAHTDLKCAKFLFTGGVEKDMEVRCTSDLCLADLGFIKPLYRKGDEKLKGNKL